METLRYVVLANSLLAVVGVAYYALLRRETYFNANRLVLWFGLAAALTLPLLELPDWRPQPVRTAMQRTAQVIVPRVLPKLDTYPADVTITFPNKKTYRAFQVHQERFVWSWQMSLVVFYAFVVFVLLIRFSLQLLSLRRLIRQSVHEAYDGFILVRNEQVTSPFSFFDWVVLNPARHTSDELEQILRHERVHVRERHSIDMIGTELVCIFFWFNPGAYLFRYLLHQTLEFRADRVVLAEGIDAKAYQYNLLKVSLSANQPTITNYFSESQLKARITMLNRQKSARTVWLKYPMLLVAVLLVAATFARPAHLKILSQYTPKVVAKKISVTSSSEKLAGLVNRSIPSVYPKPIKPALSGNSTPNLVNQPADLNKQRLQIDTVRISPSRYMMYQDDYLYWIITSKMKLEDLMVIKLELARHGCQLQLNEIKYDPLYAYIERIALSVVGPDGVYASVNESADDNKPIQANAAYMILDRNNKKDHEVRASRIDGRFSKMFPLYQTAGEENFPDLLREVAEDDRTAVSQFITDKKMDYLLLSGERKYKHLGIGFRKFDQKEIKKQSKHSGVVKVNPDGSLSINERSSQWVIKAFINNEAATLEEVQKLKINQLHTLAVTLGYDNAAQKRTGTDYLFFYVNEVN